MVMAVEGILLNVENRSHILFCPSSIFMEVAWKCPLVNNSCSDQQSCKLFDSFKSLNESVIQFLFYPVIKNTN